MNRPGFFAVYFIVASMPLYAHVISMSTGDVAVTGNKVEYVLRMPDYEIANVRDPARTIFDHIRFSSDFGVGHRTGEECRHDEAAASYICAANYEFSEPVDRLTVECSFYQITAPNHIHVLRAERDGKNDRAILDSAFSSATLTFRSATAFETAVEQMAGAVARVFSGSMQLVLLAMLGLAARTRREWAALTPIFLITQIAVALLLPPAFRFNPRFTEAAAAVALAYMGFEMTFFPASRGRWIFALLFGAFSGLYFLVYLNETAYPPMLVLSGASLASALVLALGGVFAGFIFRLRLQRFAGIAATAAGLVWFCIRMRG